jgi:hypothetical protein
MHSLRGGLDHRDDAGANGLAQLGPGGQDDGQVRVFGEQAGSAFGSAHGTRADVCCRTLAGIGLARMRRNSVAIGQVRRVLTTPVATSRMCRKSGGGGNCTLVSDSASRFSGATTTEGGAIEGNCVIGRVSTASAPEEDDDHGDHDRQCQSVNDFCEQPSRSFWSGVVPRALAIRRDFLVFASPLPGYESRIPSSRRCEHSGSPRERSCRPHRLLC